jgi:hypothetical protein
MLMEDFQTWLVANGADIVVDGDCGAATRDAISEVFTNPDAPAVTDEQLQELADYGKVQLPQLLAVAEVESSGGGYDSIGRPKILFERHKFHQATGGKYSTTSFSNPNAGGYNEDSWDKLGQAACTGEIDAAFKSASWGKFQIMGFWYPTMGYTSALEAAWRCRTSEYGHYRLLVEYIQLSNLLDEMRQISEHPDDCRPFAKGYNGSGYEDGGYHTKLADAYDRNS